jgi:hypothetical protein
VRVRLLDIEVLAQMIWGFVTETQRQTNKVFIGFVQLSCFSNG